MNDQVSTTTGWQAVKLRLEDQLEQVLKDNFTHSGSFAVGESIPAAPNPCLEIDSLGTIGLPLSARDAEAIKNVAARSPFGHGDKLVVDSTVRDTWEIDGTQIKMRNSAWDAFMGGLMEMVKKGLGVPSNTMPCKCELYKLLLYETGSHFLPHQDTEKVPGMFATIVIVLPSPYTGGEVRVLHGSEEKVLDFCGSSQQNTAVLAWYTDVLHEVKPIKSGFRLALSYNLIQTGPNSIPLLPTEDSAATHLRQVLAQWADGAFDSPPDVICYKLEHEYSQSNRSKGVSCLKGVDAHKVARLREAASGLGIAMGLGQFELHIMSQDQYEDEYAHCKRMRYDDDNDDDDDDDDDDEDREGKDDKSSDDGIIEIERNSSVSDLVDLDGIPIVPNGALCVDGQQAELVPADAFRKEDPDDEEREGYQGNAPGNINQWYKRTVLILYLKKNEKEIMLEAGGASYAMAQLKKSNPVQPTEENREYVDYALGVCWFDNTEDRFLMNVGLLWEDLVVWKKAANKWGFGADPTSIGWENVVAAWDKFGFDALRPSFEGAMPCLGSLGQQLHVIDLIKSRSEQQPQDSVVKWCEEQTARVLSSLLPPDESVDVPVYVSLIKPRGLEFFLQSIVPQLVKFDDTYRFLIDLVKCLQSQRQELEASPSHSELLQSVFHACLNAALKQWKDSKLGQYHGKTVSSLKKLDDSRVKELAGCLVSANELVLLKQFFESLVEDEEDLRVKFRDIFVPLVPDLVRVQKEHKIPIDSGVCKDFYRWLIGMYLQRMLGGKRTFICHPSVRKIGCADTTCKDCAELDKFIQSTEASHTFRYAEHRRRHLESRVADVSDLVSYKTIKEGKPHGLEVKKRKEIVDGSTWEGRQKSAKKFLASFGGDRAVKAIMGDEFADVTMALSGEKEFGSKTHVVQKLPGKLATPVNHSTSVTSGSGKKFRPAVALAKSGSAMPTNPVAGVKRKGRPGIDGPIIDLTSP